MQSSERIVVTGGSGFIGTNVVAHYVKQGAVVVNLDIRPPRDSNQQQYWRRVDILNRQELTRTLSTFSPTLLIHLCARTDLEGKSISDYSANTEGVENVIDALLGTPGLRRVIVASSMLVCRLGVIPKYDTDFCPNTVYGESKVVSEMSVRKYAVGQLPWVIVRPTSLWGPWFDTPYRGFFDSVRSGWYLHPRGRSIARSYGFVLNCVHQLSEIARAGAEHVLGRTFYLADYEPLDLLTWASAIRSRFSNAPVKQVPLGLLTVAAHVGDALKYSGFKNPPLTTPRLRNLLTDYVLDLTPTKEVCGPLPFDFRSAVDLTVDWMLRASRTHQVN